MDSGFQPTFSGPSSQTSVLIYASRPVPPTWTTLGDAERYWVHYQPFLEEQGYRLRPRYRPGWISDTLRLGKGLLECEDSIVCWGGVLDATRIVDGVQVVLKVVPTVSTETDISEFLKNEPVSDPPSFETAWEFIQFVEQVLQGLAFLHSKNIAHRDDSDPLVIKSRTRAGPMSYYIDCGLSVHFSSFEARELVTGEYGRLRKHVPEISDTVPYDAFKADVRLVGEMLRGEYLLVRV
ncbi:hypothetical protein DFH09DRAFT_1347319 [Mycena vulgaris]|nr:hypothetical protein DFH09DRAFT_1347319 [Mycena vulgaris]